MYKVSNISITGFWQKYTVSSQFNDDVNIVIGKNGTGKTTFMNILHSALLVDIESLFENDFLRIELKLKKGSKSKTVIVEKLDDGEAPYPLVFYRISNRKYTVPIFGVDDRTMPMSLRRRASEEANKVKQELQELVSLASLSVYRIGSEIDPDVRDRGSKRIVSPVDYRLENLRQRLTRYQLELSTKAREISTKLQKDVLTSLLYQKGNISERTFPHSFDEAQERRNLLVAYKQFGISGMEISRRIQEHTSAISKASIKFKELLDSSSPDWSSFDSSPLEAYQQTGRVIKLSLDSAKETEEIFQQLTVFLATLQKFIPEKSFSFSSGELQIDSESSESSESQVTIQRLSSGEKQLLILFIEALLQRQQPYIFLADEPELSLHISWQRNILPAIREINPNAQIIVATHSPEVASKFSDKIIDMEDILHV